MEMILTNDEKETLRWAVQYVFETRGSDLDFEYEKMQAGLYRVFFPSNASPVDLFHLGAVYGEVTTIQKRKSITQKL